MALAQLEPGHLRALQRRFVEAEELFAGSLPVLVNLLPVGFASPTPEESASLFPATTSTRYDMALVSGVIAASGLSPGSRSQAAGFPRTLVTADNRRS